jgi:hypothetical protein
MESGHQQAIAMVSLHILNIAPFFSRRVTSLMTVGGSAKSILAPLTGEAQAVGTAYTLDSIRWGSETGW